MTQLSFRASPVSIDADTTEISACQKMRMDGQMAFQLYIIDVVFSVAGLRAGHTWDHGETMFTQGQSQLSYICSNNCLLGALNIIKPCLYCICLLQDWVSRAGLCGMFNPSLNWEFISWKNMTAANTVIKRAMFKAVADGPVGQVLGGPLFLKVKTKFHFTESK